MTNQDMQGGPATPEPCLPPNLRKPRLRRFELPEYLRIRFGLTIAATTLAKYASIGGGPPFNVAVRTPLYPVDALDAWAEARLGKLRRSTSEG